MKQLTIALCLLSLIIPFNVFAHSGGTDSSGCHTDSSTGSSHCHGDSGGDGSGDGVSSTTMIIVGSLLAVGIAGIVWYLVAKAPAPPSTALIDEDNSLAMPQLDLLVSPEGESGGVTAKWVW